MNKTPSVVQASLTEKLTEFFSRHSTTKAGKQYTGSYLYNPKGYHFIDLFRVENEDNATIMVIIETEHTYKVKVKYSLRKRHEAEFATIQQVLEFIDTFAWKNFSHEA